MEDRTRKSGDLWSGVALAALALTIIIQARQWEYLGPEGPGPGFFPLWYGVAMLALSALLIVSHLPRSWRLPAPLDSISCSISPSACPSRSASWVSDVEILTGLLNGFAVAL